MCYNFLLIHIFSGKIQDGEILLEVNDQSIVGLTLYDLNNLIIRAPDPVRFKSVKEGEWILDTRWKFCNVLFVVRRLLGIL